VILKCFQSSLLLPVSFLFHIPHGLNFYNGSLYILISSQLLFWTHFCLIVITIIIIIIIIIIIVIINISSMQGIYTYIPDTNCVPREYSVAAILLLLFMVLISLVPVLNLLYFHISTCAVPNMAVFCSSLTSCFPGMLPTGL